MASLAGTTNAAALSTFTLNWLHTWSTTQTINSDVVLARTSIQTLVINPWLTASGGTTLDMTKAPFRLLAIVARLDLRQNAGYSGGTSAGEGRFIYNVLDGSGNPTSFMVIFEYGLDAADCVAVQNWADDWHGLGGHTFGPDYNAALQTVTDRFATIGASPGKPNGSAINQVRSDEIALSFALGAARVQAGRHLDVVRPAAAPVVHRRPDPGAQPAGQTTALDLRQRQRGGDQRPTPTSCR